MKKKPDRSPRTDTFASRREAFNAVQTLKPNQNPCTEHVNMPPQVVNGNCTAGALDILLHYHISTKEHPRATSAAAQATIRSFLRHGLLCQCETPGCTKPYTTSEKGKFFITEMLCKTPFPVEVLMDPRKV